MPFAQHHNLVRHAGNQSLFEAVELAVLSVLRGRPLHIHVEGLRGTGKTSVLRSARSFLPYIRRIKGCIQNCDPSQPHCYHHRDLGSGDLDSLGWEWVPMPFLEISHSAKLGTVVGSLDLSKLTDSDHAEASLLPGTLARAHRGVVLVDEINRLADTSPELTDVLLDVLGTKPGRLQIEETGLSPVSMPIDISVWAASNPDEEPGPLEDIRRQLSDRFDLVINVERPDVPDKVAEILGASGAVHTRGASDSLTQGRRLRSRLTRLASRDWPRFPQRLLDSLGQVYVDFGLESLRALEAWHLAAGCLALREGEGEVSRAHLIKSAPWALHHRVELGTLSEIIRFLEEHLGETGPEDDPEGGIPSSNVAASGSAPGAVPDEASPEETSAQATGAESGGLEKMFSPLKGIWESLTGSRHRLSTQSGQWGDQGTGSVEGIRTGAHERGEREGQPSVSSPAHRSIPSPPNRARPLVLLDPGSMWRGGQV